MFSKFVLRESLRAINNTIAIANGGVIKQDLKDLVQKGLSK
jgi:hypothetical protein